MVNGRMLSSALVLALSGLAWWAANAWAALAAAVSALMIVYVITTLVHEQAVLGERRSRVTRVAHGLFVLSLWLRRMAFGAALGVVLMLFVLGWWLGTPHSHQIATHAFIFPKAVEAERWVGWITRTGTLAVLLAVAGMVGWAVLSGSAWCLRKLSAPSRFRE